MHGIRRAFWGLLLLARLCRHRSFTGAQTLQHDIEPGVLVVTPSCCHDAEPRTTSGKTTETERRKETATHSRINTGINGGWRTCKVSSPPPLPAVPGPQTNGEGIVEQATLVFPVQDVRWLLQPRHSNQVSSLLWKWHKELPTRLKLAQRVFPGAGAACGVREFLAISPRKTSMWLAYHVPSRIVSVINISAGGGGKGVQRNSAALLPCLTVKAKLTTPSVHGTLSNELQHDTILKEGPSCHKSRRKKRRLAPEPGAAVVAPLPRVVPRSASAQAGEEDRIGGGNMAHANTMLYVTRVSFCIFVLFAMYLLGMLFYARTTARPSAPVIVYQKAAPCPSAAPLKALADMPSSTPPAPPSTSSSTAKTARASFAAPETAETEVQQQQQHYHLFCFFNQSAQQGPSTMSLDVSQIPVGLCTHLVYSSLGINSRGFTLSLEGHDVEQGAIERFAAFGQPSKVLVAVGGSRHDWRAYQDIASDRRIARDFGHKLRRWFQDQNFDGAVIDWPVPAKQRDATELVQEVKRALNGEQLLAVLLPHDQRRRRKMFDVRRLVAIADFLLFRMYGSHGPHRTEYPITEQDISLFPKAARSETGRDGFEKACMVLPLSGLSFVRAISSASLSPGAPARGLGPAGRYSRQAGSLAYHELCAANWTKVHAGHYGTAASRGSIWVGYHDATQLARIVHVARRRHGARCFGLWALGDDDYRGSCGATKFPLVRAVAAECKAAITT
ncbi:hypothetical protein HPB49_021809 [Dermacentor silvarum]|uniref:Uncharacterized protein n=1 Tax=Dermacentor silvarum TaxID=543639 RepID=A0ACB8E3C2_DERSI|nr:hypothetical protein HPB49_021809 [Dermacentor silvarum]